MSDRSGQWSFVPVAKLAEVAGDWDDVNRRSANLPILDARFFARLLEHFPAGEGAAVGVLRVAERVRCAGIFEPGSFGRWQTYQPSQAPLGAFVNEPGLDVADSLRRFLGRASALSSAVALSQLDPDMLPRPAANGSFETLDYIETATLEIAGSFADFWAARGKNLRTNLKRQRSRFEKDGVSTRLAVLTDRAAVELAVDEYGHIESRGWKGANGTALHPDNAQGRFYRSMLGEYAANGEAVVYQYRFNDDLVATDLCVMRDGVLIILKTTHAETDKNVSPAMLMRQEAFEPMFDQRQFRRVEFYGKMMDWHGRLTDKSRVLYHLNCFRFPWLSGLRKALRRRSGANADVRSGSDASEKKDT
jgi:CelD/BcsL family acetyltransferase involved in cellulose biosynthesis